MYRYGLHCGGFCSVGRLAATNTAFTGPLAIREPLGQILFHPCGYGLLPLLLIILAVQTGKSLPSVLMPYILATMCFSGAVLWPLLPWACQISWIDVAEGCF